MKMDKMDIGFLFVFGLGLTLLAYSFMEIYNRSQLCTEKGGIYVDSKCLKVEIISLKKEK